MRRLVAGWLIVVVAGVAAACREATPPFTSVDRPDEADQLPRQLTFASADDRSPHWHPSEPSLTYVTEGYSPFVQAPGLVLSVPSGGGSSSPALPRLQFPGGPRDRFSAPAVSPDGTRLAWVDLRSLLTPNVCPATAVMCTPEGAGLGPRLAEVRVRVTSIGEGGGADVQTTVPAAGVESVSPEGGLTSFETRMHPFQVLYHVEASAVFRPSWSPSGDRLVFSDGLQLLVWEVGGSSPAPIPGTDDAVHAAWSPDGTWVAFTRLVRGDPIQMSCTHSVPLGPVCTQERTEWPILARIVTVIRADGTQANEVGPGDDPAWTPDSGRLVFRRDGRLWVAGLDGSGVTEILGSEGGREPTVSPDGGMVAFARIDPSVMRHDLWVVAMPGGGS